MPIPMLQHIPLSSAYLCQDCNSIGNCARQCPACASEVLMSLSGVLNREVQDVAAPSYSYETALVA
jgi:ferredoxin